MQYIPWAISFLMLVFAVMTYFRNGHNDKKQEDKEKDTKMDYIKESLIRVDMKLDTVRATTDETRSDIKHINNDISQLDRRLTIAERDLKTAFNHIDDIRDGK